MNRGSETARVAASPARTGFNEAPIHESGKSESPDRTSGRHSRASMRPRFMNRGSYQSIHRVNTYVQLQ